jgi:branched-chain amino acid transport system permease protein
MERFLDVTVAGLMLGGLYALIAMGMSLQYGVARVFNIAHGEFIMLGAMSTYTLFTVFHVSPLLAVAICGPLAFVLGYFVHVVMFRKLQRSAPNQGAFESSSMLASFGLMFVIQNVALLAWGPEIRQYSYMTQTFSIFGAQFGLRRLVTLAFAVGIGVMFYLFLVRTRIGKAIRAAGQDASIAGLMGVNINWVLALCFGLGAAMAGAAGVLISICYPDSAVMGQEYLTVAIIVVVLGGLGSIPGSFIGGFLLGIIGSIVAFYDPGLTMVAFYAIFVILLLVRPKGILGR